MNVVEVKTVTVIPPKKIRKSKFQAELKPKKRRVAAYARVSTDEDEQLNSYDAQIDYYTKYIQENPDWEFVKVYTDEGISGLMTKKREGFQQMIQDALAGKIDLILTKSVSRFARNTVDTLSNVRKLKEYGVTIFFEKENIWTDDAKGELLITIMSSLAQEESRSISENVTWGQRKRFADGKVSMPYKSFLGFRKGEDGKPEVIPEEAAIVRRIYREFLQGQTYNGIARSLTREGIKTPRGKTKWSSSTIKSILQNEKYKGDALLQKSFIVDFLTKKQKINEGEVPQYYVTNSHEAIVNDEIFDLVQHEIECRNKSKQSGSSVNFFSGRIICASCGEPFTRKVWHSNSKYKRYVWQCGKKYVGNEVCHTPHLLEDEIQAAFIRMVSELIYDKETIVITTKNIIAKVLDPTSLEQEQDSLQKCIDVLYTQLEEQLAKRAKRASDNEEELAAYETLIRDYETKVTESKSLKERIENMKKRRFSCQHFIESLGQLKWEKMDFNENLWLSLVDKVIVQESSNHNFVFILKDGTERSIAL
ncbi:MAG: recombinase family protein [Saccharofermentanales bacterium]|jgi:site-specific DNA recombinase